MFEFPKTTGCSPVAAVEKSYITPDILSRMETRVTLYTAEAKLFEAGCENLSYPNIRMNAANYSQQ